MKKNNIKKQCRIENNLAIITKILTIQARLMCCDYELLSPSFWNADVNKVRNMQSGYGGEVFR